MAPMSRLSLLQDKKTKQAKRTSQAPACVGKKHAIIAIAVCIALVFGATPAVMAEPVNDNGNQSSSTENTNDNTVENTSSNENNAGNTNGTANTETITPSTTEENAVSYSNPSQETVSKNASKSSDQIKEDAYAALLKSSGLTEAQLAELESQINSKQGELDTISAEIQALEDRISALEGEISAAEELLNRAKIEKTALKAKETLLNTSLTRNRTKLAAIAEQEYKLSNNGLSSVSQVIFGGEDLETVIETLDSWMTIETRQTRLISDISTENTQLDEVAINLDAAQETIDQIEAGLDASRSTLETAKAEKTAKMASIQSNILLLRGRQAMSQYDYIRTLCADDIIAPGTMTESERLLRTAIVNSALSCLGADYVWGGESWEEGGFDCSGLCQYAYGENGIHIARVANSQYITSPKIMEADLRPGDLIFFGSSPEGIYHVIMYIGDGLTIEAPNSGDVVKIRPLAGRSNIYGYASPLAGFSF